MISKDNNIHLAGYHATKYENLEKILYSKVFNPKIHKTKKARNRTHDMRRF